MLRMSMTGELPENYAVAFAEAKARGNASFAAGDFHAALKHYREASDANPSSAIPPSNSALVLLRLGRPDDAAIAASAALELLAAHPDRPGTVQLTIKTLLRRAAARRAVELHALAVHDLREILMLQPGHQEATKQLNELKAAYPEAITLSDPDNGVVQRHRPRIVEVSGHSRKIVNEKATSRREFKGETSKDRESGQKDLRQSVLQSQDDTSTSVSVDHHNDLRTTSASAVHTLTARCANTVPRNCAEFEQAWRTLRQDILLRCRFLACTVGPARLQNGLLGDSVTSHFVQEAAIVLTAGIDANLDLVVPAYEVMCALSRVSRFNLAVLFLSEQEKQSISRLCRRMAARGLSAEQLLHLRSCYSIS